jgi:hypothetical protein
MQKENQKNENKFTSEVLMELDYLLAEGFICLTNPKNPTIVLNQEATI